MGAKMSEEVPSFEHYIPGALEVIKIEPSGDVIIAICIEFKMQNDISYTEAMLSHDGFEPCIASGSRAYYESWSSRMHEGGFPLSTSCIIFKPGATHVQE